MNNDLVMIKTTDKVIRGVALFFVIILCIIAMSIYTSHMEKKLDLKTAQIAELQANYNKAQAEISELEIKLAYTNNDLEAATIGNLTATAENLEVRLEELYSDGTITGNEIFIVYATEDGGVCMETSLGTAECEDWSLLWDYVDVPGNAYTETLYLVHAETVNGHYVIWTTEDTVNE